MLYWVPAKSTWRRSLGWRGNSPVNVQWSFGEPWCYFWSSPHACRALGLLTSSSSSHLLFRNSGQRGPKKMIVHVWCTLTCHRVLQHTFKVRAPGRKEENGTYFRLCVCGTCLIRGPTLTAHTAVLLLGRQGFQDDVGGSEPRQRDVSQVGERVFFSKQLAGFPPLAQEPAFRK